MRGGVSSYVQQVYVLVQRFVWTGLGMAMAGVVVGNVAMIARRLEILLVSSTCSGEALRKYR